MSIDLISNFFCIIVLSLWARVLYFAYKNRRNRLVIYDVFSVFCFTFPIYLLFALNSVFKWNFTDWTHLLGWNYIIIILILSNFLLLKKLVKKK